MVKRTKTMMQTIQDGKDFVDNLEKKEKAKAKVNKKIAKTTKKVKKAEKSQSQSSSEKPKPSPKKEAKKPVKKVVAKPPSKPATKSAKAKPDQKKVLAKSASRMSVQGPKAGIVDVVFCCDTTGSMGSYLQRSKSCIEQIIKRIYEKCKPEQVSTKFGFVAYRDHSDKTSTYLTKTQNLCSAEECIEFVKKQDANGGGDFPQAVFQGLYQAAKNIKWRISHDTPILRYIFHIADAPPHGSQFTTETQPASTFPGPTLDQVAVQINSKQIHYRLIKIGGSLDRMAEAFKAAFFNYEEQVIDRANGMDIKISDMIIRQLMPDPQD